MNRAQVEALLFRLNAAIPPRRSVDPLLERARAEEWADSPLADVDPADAAEAFDRWKASADEQPTLRQFIAACRQLAADRADMLPEPEHVVDPELLERIRRFNRARGLLRRPPGDDTATVRVPGAGLVHDATARRLRTGR